MPEASLQYPDIQFRRKGTRTKAKLASKLPSKSCDAGRPKRAAASVKGPGTEACPHTAPPHSADAGRKDRSGLGQRRGAQQEGHWRLLRANAPDPTDGSRQDGQVRLDSKVGSLASWMNGGRWLRLGGQSNRLGKDSILELLNVWCPQKFTWKCVQERMMAVLGPGSLT